MLLESRIGILCDALKHPQPDCMDVPYFRADKPAQMTP